MHAFNNQSAQVTKLLHIFKIMPRKWASTECPAASQLSLPTLLYKIINVARCS